MPEPQPKQESARTKFLQPKIVVEGTITQVLIQQDPFHCILKITPTNPEVIPIEGRYSDNQLSLGKLKRNLAHLKFPIEGVEDILIAVESLEGRKCDFRIDDSGWLAWISKLHNPSPKFEPPPPPPPEKIDPVVEIFFLRIRGYRAIYYMEDPQGVSRGYAVGPTGEGRTRHGWVLNIKTLDEAKEILKHRKI